MKDLKNLNGAKVISKNEQKSIKGGVVYIYCDDDNPCPIGFICMMGPFGGRCVK